MASRCEDSRVTSDVLNEMPNFHIDIFSELKEQPGRFAEVLENDVEKFIEGKDDHFLLFRKMKKKSCLLSGNFISIYIINSFRCAHL